MEPQSARLPQAPMLCKKLHELWVRTRCTQQLFVSTGKYILHTHAYARTAVRVGQRCQIGKKKKKTSRWFGV